MTVGCSVLTTEPTSYAQTFILCVSKLRNCKKTTAPYKQYTRKYSPPGIMGKITKSVCTGDQTLPPGGHKSVKGLARET